MFAKVTKIVVISTISLALCIWLLTGVYTVSSSENAVVLRFGEHVKTVTKAGLNWHLPAPIEKVEKVNISEVRRLEFGYETIVQGGSDKYAEYASKSNQSLMLTGDENMVNIEAALQYRIRDVEDYLFNVKNPMKTLNIAAESSIRRVIANHLLDEVLTDSKFSIQQEIKEDLQNICNSYGMGIIINEVALQDVSAPDEVDAAFKDVANAREDKNSYINQAESYRNEVIPKARGNKAKILNEAEAYKEKRIAEAKGDVANFLQILEKYNQSKDVTRTRMYLETMEEILPGIEKYILDENGNTIKLLPLDENSSLTQAAQ